ncbi:MAG: hypothetical protein MUC36_24900 [Planctomycetes bacterium]|jgi:hypothetical protein|nr:hypothetical protein [Planctomycetota bacterium]
MNFAPRLLLPLALGLSMSTLPAQDPVEAPPWWRVQDDVTVSLYWSFDTPFAPGTFPPPTLAVAPQWYNPAVTQGVITGNLRYLPNLAGRVGVLGVQPAGAPQTAVLDLTVDNDPYPDWIKIFWFQFDALEGSTGDIKVAIEQDLAKYKRSGVTITTTPLPGGWEQVTVEAQLIPQPDDEGIDWTFLENGAAIGIDNLYVNSKCVKPGADEKGGALGAVDGAIFDLGVQAPGRTFQGIAVTEGPAPLFQRTYWISTQAQLPGGFHEVLQLNQLGTPVGTTFLPDTLISAPGGIKDLAIETVPITSTTSQQFVYALVDRRPSGGDVVIQALSSNGSLATARNLTLLGFPSLAQVPTARVGGLAFDPSGDRGNGSFWVTATNAGGQGLAIEFLRPLSTPGFGQLNDTRPIPAECVGLGYDAVLGYFYGFSRATRPSPNGPVEVNGFEWSGYDFQLTGVQFCGDLLLTNVGGPRGGRAAGLDVYRRRVAPGQTSELRIACLVEASPVAGQTRQYLYELSAPYRFGWSQVGRCGMRGGAPFLGSTTFEVTLSGVPDALFGLCYLGFSNTLWNGAALPLPLASIGLLESSLSISPDVSSALLTPSATGEFVLPVPLPTTATLGYSEVFFQWFLLDPTVPGFLVGSQAGKTVLYP